MIPAFSKSRNSRVKQLKLTVIALLAALPLLALGTTVMFEKLGCVGSGLGYDPTIPACVTAGLNLDPLYRTAETLTFWSIIFAPVSLIWILGGGYLFYKTKRSVT